MVKLLKILGRIIGISLEWTLLLITVFAFIIRTSPVQTYLAKQATDFLSKELNTTIKIDRVSIVFIDRVALDGVFVLDQKKDTLADISRIYASLGDLNLKKNFLRLSNVSLEKGKVKINRDSLTGDYNYWFITDYFDSGKPQKKKKPFTVALSRLNLDKMEVFYDDYRKSYSDFGMDYDHLHFKNVTLVAKNIQSRNGSVTAYVKHLSTIESCGFLLKKFSAYAAVSQYGIKFNQVQIWSGHSRIQAPKFHMLMNGRDDLQTFVDSVTFDAKIRKSNVSLLDVSYFATALEGMNQRVYLSGDMNNKVKDLKISNLELHTGQRTVLRGTFKLPDFRQFEKSPLHENIDYAYVSINDLEHIKLPNSASTQYLSFDKYLKRLAYFETTNVKIDGYKKQFVIAADKISTALGKVNVDNGILFTENQINNSYIFEKSNATEYDFKVENFQLGKFLDDKNFGVVDGTFFVAGEAFSTADIHFNLIEGNLNRFDYLGYAYEDIYIQKGQFVDKKFEAKIEIKDDNLNLVYDGFIDFNGNQHMQFSIDLTKAILDNLNISQKENTSLTSNFRVNILGKTNNTMSGSVVLDGMLYKEGDKQIEIPSLTLEVVRGRNEDIFAIHSLLADVELRGKVDFTTLVNDFTQQFKKVFPSIAGTPIKRPKNYIPSTFEYDVRTNDMEDFLSIFVPDLWIAPGTQLKGKYNGVSASFNMDLISPKVVYQDREFHGVSLLQSLTEDNISADYTVQKFVYNDSVQLDEVHFSTFGTQNDLKSRISWNPNTSNKSLIVWETNIIDNKNLKIILEPSYFSINDMRWEIENKSNFSLSDRNIDIAKFKVQRGKQFISVDGRIADNDADKLNFKVNDINLQEVSTFFGTSVEMKGLVNGWGYISNPYSNLYYMGDAYIKQLELNNQEVGDVFVQSQWNKGNESIGLLGDLMYRGNQTFSFDGSYYLERKENNLDFNLVFDHTDIQFANAFMDPKVVDEIRGLVDGRLKVTGTPDFPKLKGKVNLISASAMIDMLGVHFGFDGVISADEYGFYIDNMPVTDEEGNTGSLIGSVYHDQYKDWNFDLQFDLENNNPQTFSPFFSALPSGNSMEKFLVLNTEYEEGNYYYGKGYVTGTANIFGYADNIEITVDVQTKKGTTINFPMYGVSDLDEENNFITFRSQDTSYTVPIPKIDYTGVELNFNFRVTPDAKLKIIFNEQTADEISASGSGDIAMKLSNLGDLSMDGTYRVKDGLYNFALGPIKQPFHIEEGGTITWTGDPYNATLAIKTFYEVSANLSEISPDQIQNTGQGPNQKILCYLELTESLMKPTINFDIKAPKADETGKALLARITSDKDELNRQFFSLLLWKRFQPLKGSTAAGGSAAMDLVTNQINSILSQVSKDYKLNVDLASDNLTGENTVAVGVSKGFLEDRLIISGSFGVENTNQQNQSALIGDVSLEYLLNESGTFRINIFNESNDYSIIQDKNLGLFTQGVGIHYQEDFDNIENFKLAQYFLDIFRTKGNKKYPVKKNKRQTKVPPLNDGTKLFNLPEEFEVAHR